MREIGCRGPGSSDIGRGGRWMGGMMCRKIKVSPRYARKSEADHSFRTKNPATPPPPILRHKITTGNDGMYCNDVVEKKGEKKAKGKYMELGV